MKRSTAFGLVLVPLLLVAAPTLAQAPDAGEEPLEEPVTVVVNRGNHLVVHFWPDRRWYGNSIVGGFVSMRDGMDPEELAGVGMDLVRFEFVGPRDEVLPPGLDLEELNARVGKDLREVERRSIRVGEAGQFRFDDLRAGLYSVRIDWDEVPAGQEYLFAQLRYPEHDSDLQALLVPAVTPAQADRGVTDRDEE